MSDIVERLRRLGKDSVGNYGIPICTEAADEIERLRADIERYRKHYVTQTAYDAVKAELADMRSELKTVRNQLQTAYGYGRDGGEPPWMRS